MCGVLLENRAFSFVFFFFSSRRRHTRWTGDWSSDVCSSDLLRLPVRPEAISLNALMADCVSGSLKPDGADPTRDRCIERMPYRPRILESVSVEIHPMMACGGRTMATLPPCDAMKSRACASSAFELASTSTSVYAPPESAEEPG